MKTYSLIHQFFGKHITHCILFSVFINLANLAPSIYMLQVYDRVLPSRSNETLIMLTLLAAYFLAAQAILDYLRGRLLTEAAMQLEQTISTQAIQQHLSDKISIKKQPDYPLLKDIATLRHFIGGHSLIALLDAPWFIFYLLVIYWFHPLLGNIALAGSLLLVTLALLSEHGSKQFVQISQPLTRRASQMIDDAYQHSQVICSMHMQPAIINSWQQQQQQINTVTRTFGKLAGKVSSHSKLLRQLLQIAMMGAGAYLVIDQHLSSGVMLATTIILGKALAPVESLTSSWKTIVQAMMALRNLSPLLAPPTSKPATLPSALDGHLSVENITIFGQRPDIQILKNISWRLEAGKQLAIIGPNGSGKTTLARVIAGATYCDTGSVRLDGINYANGTIPQMGDHIGYLPQDLSLLSGTVAENISRFQPADHDKIIAASRMAGAHEMILKLPSSYETLIGEGGIQLSGGQLQRIALARALYDQPALVVLDEPNAYLDHDGEQALQATLLQLKTQGTTTVIITHRPSLTQYADQLLVMNAGRVEKMGSRADILAVTHPTLQANHA